MSFREFDFPPRRSFRIYLYLQFTIGARGNTILARSSLGFCMHDYAPGARAPAEAPARAHTTVAFGNPAARFGLLVDDAAASNGGAAGREERHNQGRV